MSILKQYMKCRDLESMDDVHFGVHKEMLYARNVPAVKGAQWTGIVTQIAIEMLEKGTVEAVVCVQSDEHDRFKPKPVSCLPWGHHNLQVAAQKPQACILLCCASY